MNTLYLSSVKAILGVRRTTPNSVLCWVESGFPTLNAFVKERQSFMYKGIRHLYHVYTRRGMTDDPLMFALTLAEAENTKAWLHIKSVMAESDYLRKDRVKLYALTSRQKSAHIRSITRYWGQVLCTPDVWYQRKSLLCIYTVRFRFSAHNLKVETGRWARLPMEE